MAAAGISAGLLHRDQHLSRVSSSRPTFRAGFSIETNNSRAPETTSKPLTSHNAKRPTPQMLVSTGNHATNVGLDRGARKKC
jgi:hypothetical protein